MQRVMRHKTDHINREIGPVARMLWPDYLEYADLWLADAKSETAEQHTTRSCRVMAENAMAYACYYRDTDAIE